MRNNNRVKLTAALILALLLPIFSVGSTANVSASSQAQPAISIEGLQHTQSTFCIDLAANGSKVKEL